MNKRAQKKSVAMPRHTPKEQTGQHTPAWWERDVKKQSAVRCSSCGAVFLKGHWHTVQGMLQKHVREVALATCPACAAEKTGKNKQQWAGEVVIRQVGAVSHAAVLAAVHAFGVRARSRDPEDRILSIDAKRDSIVIRTFQNQMAVRLAKKLDHAFKGGQLKISYSSDDLPIRITWTFPTRLA